MFRLRVLEEIVKMAGFGAASLIAVLLLCEYVLKPLWHLILIR
jgi:hypothetical protein